MPATPSPTTAGAPPPEVVLEPDALVIRQLRVADPDVLAAVRRHVAAAPAADLAAWTLGLLALGCRAAALGGGVVDDAAIGLRLDGLTRQVDTSAQSAAARVEAAVLAATHPESGAVARAVQEALARLSGDVRGLVAGEGAPVRTAVDQALARASRAMLDEIGRNLAAQTHSVRAALAADDPAGPFAALRREVRASSDQTRAELARQIGDVRALVEAGRARAELMAKTSHHQGVTYEEAVAGAVTEVAAALGDTVEPTGHMVGLRPGSKVGDVVASIADRTTGGRPVSVVIEAKSTQLSSRRWKQELAEARENRGAHGAVGVVNGLERMPGRARTVFVLDPGMVVVAWQPGEPLDLLAAVYQLCRAAAVAAAVQEAGPGSPDVAQLTAALADAYESLAGFDALLRAESAARRGLDDVRIAARQLRIALEHTLARGLRLDDRHGA